MRREVSFNEVHDAQRFYRLVMDSMARPGKINLLNQSDVMPPDGLNKASALVAFSLLNSDVYFHYAGRNTTEVINYLLLNTSCSPVDVQHADFLFIPGDDEGGILSEMKRGTLAYPEEGATLVVDVKSITDRPGDGSMKIILRGPGIENKMEVFVEGLNENILVKLAEVNDEFPLGVDAILTDISGRIICIPRSNKFSQTH